MRHQVTRAVQLFELLGALVASVCELYGVIAANVGILIYWVSSFSMAQNWQASKLATNALGRCHPQSAFALPCDVLSSSDIELRVIVPCKFLSTNMTPQFRSFYVSFRINWRMRIINNAIVRFSFAHGINLCVDVVFSCLFTVVIYRDYFLIFLDAFWWERSAILLINEIYVCVELKRGPILLLHIIVCL